MILGVSSTSFHLSYSTQKPYTFPTPLYIIILTPHFYRKVGAPMCSPSPPATPDFKGAAQEQGNANIDAARAQGKLNNPNVYSPYGSQTVSYDGDQPTITQSFSPEQQAIYDQGNATKLQLSQLSGQGAQALQGVVGKQVDFGGAPSAPGDYSSMRNQTIDAMMARPKEDYARATDQAQSDLVAAGIRPGTKAYDDKMQLLQRGLNDANTQAAGNAGILTSQAYQMDMDRRKQAITEQLAQRQMPLNEITALMSGSQVSNPSPHQASPRTRKSAPRRSLPRSRLRANGVGTITTPIEPPWATSRTACSHWARPVSVRWAVAAEAGRAGPRTITIRIARIQPTLGSSASVHALTVDNWEATRRG